MTADFFPFFGVSDQKTKNGMNPTLEFKIGCPIFKVVACFPSYFKLEHCLKKVTNSQSPAFDLHNPI